MTNKYLARMAQPQFQSLPLLERRLINNVSNIIIDDAEVWCSVIVIDEQSRKIQGYQKPSVLLHPSFNVLS